jgi:hypothetical protein
MNKHEVGPRCDGLLVAKNSSRVIKDRHPINSLFMKFNPELKTKERN